MGKVLSMCFEPRVLAVLTAVGVLVWIVAPSLLAPVVPLLLVAACPLSMLAMAWMMRSHLGKRSSDPSNPALDASAPPAAVVVAPGDGRGPQG